MIAQAQIIAFLSAAPMPELTLTPTLVSIDTPLPTETSAPTETPTFTPTFTELSSPTLTLTPTETFTPLPTAMEIPPARPLTINYTYDPLYRLTAADYNDDQFYHYTYDSVGNRLTQESMVSAQSSVSSYQYSGLGDRLSQTVNGQTTTYTLDLNAGLTQVLSDGTNTYLYGVGRIAQSSATTEYFLGDTLGSVRQLADNIANVTLTKSYAPYGEVRSTAGSGKSVFAYTGEQVDASGLTYLRARYYASNEGRYISRDIWNGDTKRPLSLNRWMYVEGNPTNFTDPSGMFPEWCKSASHQLAYEMCVRNYYRLSAPRYSSNFMSDKVYGSPGCWRGAPAYEAGGYIESMGVFTLFFNGSISHVFDFATMESQPFQDIFIGIGDAMFAINGFISFSGAYGFDNTSDIVRDYSGPYYFANFGLSTDAPIALPVGIGTGLTFTVSANPFAKIITAGAYYSAGASEDPLPIADILVGIGVTHTALGVRRTYAHDGKVNTGRLLADISLGHPVISIFYGAIASHYRIAGAETALYWTWIYNEVHAND